MPNYLEMLRLRNLFNPGTMQSPDQGDFTMPPMGGSSPFDNVSFGNTNMSAMPPAPQGGGDDYDVAARMAQIYHPQHDASDRFDQLIGGYPSRPQLSRMRRLGAAILGTLGDSDPFSAPSGRGQYAYNEVTGENDFNKNVMDWKNQVGPAQQAANLERYTNSNERMLANQTISEELRNRGQENKVNIEQGKLENAKNRTAIYDFKTKNPSAKIIAPKGGNIQIVNPVTGKVQDTGISSGTLSDLDRINLQAEDKMLQIERQGEITGENIGKRGEEARKTRATVPGGARIPTNASGKPLPPSQVRIQQHDSARQFAAQNPEFSKFIQFGPGQNDFNITAPGENHWYDSTNHPSQEQYDQIVSAIYGDHLPISQPGRTGSTPVNKPNMGTKPLTSQSPIPSHIQRKAPPGWKYVPKAGGGYTAVEEDTGAQ